MNTNVSLKEHGKKIVCEECGHDRFIDTFYLFKVSKLVTMQTQDTIAPVPTFECSKCGHVNTEFDINQLNI